jgi:hypothetical protein
MYKHSLFNLGSKKHSPVDLYLSFKFPRDMLWCVSVKRPGDKHQERKGLWGVRNSLLRDEGLGWAPTSSIQVIQKLHSVISQTWLARMWLLHSGAVPRPWVQRETPCRILGTLELSLGKAESKGLQNGSDCHQDSFLDPWGVQVSSGRIWSKGPENGLPEFCFVPASTGEQEAR